MFRSTLLSVVCVFALWLWLPSECHAQTQEENNDLFIQNATVLTVTEGTIENADILVQDGTIQDVGTNLSAPAGITEIDATGQYVSPGIVDSHAHIAITSVNEATSPVTAEVSVGDVLNPFDVRIYRALAGGVTTSHVMHGSANVIGGQNETIKHHYGVRNPDDLRMDGAPNTIKFALGENPMRVYGEGRNVQPSTRMGVEDVARRALTEAQRYMEAQEQYEAGTRNAPPEHSERLEVLAGILRGDVLVQAHSYRADEILTLLAVIEDFDIDRIVFHHAMEAFKVAPELAEAGAMASVFMDWWSFKVEAYFTAPHNAAILMENGVTASIHSDSPEINRHMYHEAAKTQRYGDLSDEEAMATVTINPAIQLGIDDRVGSIEPGKDADLVITDKHPLSVYAVPQQTIVEGVVRFDVDEDPDDMRLLIDPAQEVAQPVEHKYHHHHHVQHIEDVLLN